jgi:osmotically-inducible protein OsmY
MVQLTLPVSRPYGCDMVGQAQERLRAVPYISYRNLRCEYRHGLLILQGQVESDYEKQLAQEAVARLEGVTQVVNELEVLWADRNGQRRSVL